MSLNVPNPARLLLFGNDPILLETRAQVLRSSGPIVDIAIDVDALAQRIASANSSYIVLICCYTATEAECSELVAIAERHRIAMLQLERFLAPTELIQQVSNLIKVARSKQHTSPPKRG